MLLEQLGLTFTVQKRSVSEDVDASLAPPDVVKHLALRKAMPVAAAHPTALTLGADTVVVHEGDILNKPTSEADACAMLRRLSGTTHTVYTGYALLHPASDRTVRGVAQTDVTLGTLSDAEVSAYVATGSPLDKAGGYGIQDSMGPLFVEAIHGDYYTVVGLPLRSLYETLSADFGDLLSF
jgi:septum formation protein